MDKLKYSKYEWLVVIQNINSGNIYNVTHMTNRIEQTSEWMTGMAGTLELELVITPDNNITWLTKARNGLDEKHGHLVQFSVDNKIQFKGYITKVAHEGKHIVRVTARDQIFYLKSKDILYTENMTASEIFTDICKRKSRMVYRVDTPATKVLDPYYHGTDYTMFAAIKLAIDKANIAEEKQYLIRDEMGVLVFTELSKLLTNLQLGDNEYVFASQYESSIEYAVYNHVRAFRANEEIGMFDTWVVKDSETINRWGQLNLLFEVDTCMTDAEIIALTEKKLEFYNSPKETLTISALGHLDIHACNGIRLNIGNLDLSGSFWITHCKHIYKNNYHTMDLELFYVA